MSRTTGGTTVFVGTGPFADAGSISSNGVAKLSKGSLDLNQNIRVKRTINPTTCFVSLIVGGTISLGLGTGDQEGISGTLPVRGQSWPSLSSTRRCRSIWPTSPPPPLCTESLVKPRASL